MKRVYLTVLSALMSVFIMFGQGQFTSLSGTYSGKMKYVPGKNVYLLDEYRLDYNYKVVMGEPRCEAQVAWTRNNGYTVDKKNVAYSRLSQHPDLQQRFDLLVPDSAVFTYTVMLYSEQSKCYIASAKTRLVVPYIEKTAAPCDENKKTIEPLTPIKLSWLNDFSNVTLGKQMKEKPGVVVNDAAITKAFETDKLNVGKMEKTQKGFSYRLRKVFRMASKLDIVNVTVDFKWNDENYDIISDELNRRETAMKLFTAGNGAKARDAYFANRKYPIVIGTDNQMFWMSTVPPANIWKDAIEEGDRLYAQKKWTEASAYYQLASNAAPDMAYPAARIAKIKNYINYKNNRSVGSLELVYVEGKNGMKSFYMSKTEVTQGQWRQVMGTSPSINKGRNNPVENVSWEDAQAYVKALNKETGMNYRLPRLQEWEYAAKGGAISTSTEYAGGNNLDEVSWCAYNSNEHPHPVGEKTPNEIGLFDMTGNVSEWVVDQFDQNTRFIKGGSWSDDASKCTISTTEKVPVKYKNGTVGFRVVQDE